MKNEFIEKKLFCTATYQKSVSIVESLFWLVNYVQEKRSESKSKKKTHFHCSSIGQADMHEPGVTYLIGKRG